MLTSPILDLQKQVGASVGEAYGWNLPNVYSSIEEEHTAATKGVGLVDRSYVGRIRVEGGDSIDLLDRLTTNKLDELEQSRMMGTVLTTNKGRIVDLLFVLRREDHLLIMVSPQNREKALEAIDFYVFTEDVTLRDVTEETAMLSLLGPNSASLLDELTGQSVSSLELYDSISSTIIDSDALIVRTDFAGVQGYDVIVPASQAGQVWSGIASQDEPVKPVGMDALELVRIEHGVPAHGKDMSESNNPLEANLLRFISFNKGCYVGQEVVARLNTYDKVQKHLVGLSWKEGNTVAEGSNLYFDGKKVGTITSKAFSPRLQKNIGLGYVRKAHSSPGKLLTTRPDDSGTVITIENLPINSSAILS